MMTLQEMFATVWNHFITEDRPFGMDSTVDACRYRGPNGERCAAGLFISDEHYDLDFEGQGVSPTGRNRVAEALVCSGVPFELLPYLAALQACHDSSARYGPEVNRKAYFKSQLRSFAERHNLTIPE